ncbi:hypothetical protein BCR44DRAFT_1423029 [Catenaria anguillulae PL171]|uniref:Uncharacterized protein n=1 Tax=Catenaria anguillulae PL171 TaxID=765915 RepID=A0A1Y2I3V3_9FUNG|nr:hypothetical protein BCR44DRAFT_1423029 [Catenaria anguillulae PL171]
MLSPFRITMTIFDRPNTVIAATVQTKRRSRALSMRGRYFTHSFSPTSSPQSWLPWLRLAWPRRSQEGLNGNCSRFCLQASLHVFFRARFCHDC